MEATSGSYLDRMESFLSKHDNASLTDLVKEDENADNYEVNYLSSIRLILICNGLHPNEPLPGQTKFHS